MQKCAPKSVAPANEEILRTDINHPDAVRLCADAFEAVTSIRDTDRREAACGSPEPLAASIGAKPLAPCSTRSRISHPAFGPAEGLSETADQSQIRRAVIPG